MITRVLLCDDVAEYRLLVRLALEEDPQIHVIGEAADGLEACRLVERLVPDVVLLDLAMPELDGLECIPRMRAAAPDACIIVLSGFQAERMAGPVMATGADGYLEKGVTLSVVRERILAGRTAPAVT